MNKTLETIRGSWITRDRETAEANRNVLHSSIDQIPANLREIFLSVLEWEENTEGWNDVIIDGACKDSDRHLNEIIFLEAQIKTLVKAIRQTKDIDSIRALRMATRETIDRMHDRKYQEEQERLAEELASRNPATQG
jgi:hypothetical protein